MNRLITVTQRLVLTALLGAGAANVQAEPVKLEATIASKGDVSLEFADGSQHVVRLVQREGQLKGSGPLDGASMLEWGMHDMTLAQGSADGSGYLVITKSPTDIAYLKFVWRARMSTGDNGQPLPLLAGHWEVVGATGTLKGLSGLGTLRIHVLKGSDRHWVMDGELKLPGA
ncbi:TPA: hypothetical protein MXR76_006387 [Pseudomonas aeruginosa]|nr:hypothetical protein [Pseudomonas aeruginosa]HCA5868828.1 hypothetical protein [Pseudomonas aeruginosa]HCA7379605.1 hypothetical protein [Pseudomonas aeruginosa]HCA7777466.1 hypothetical protein [Pseudomonas aeruginosa]